MTSSQSFYSVPCLLCAWVFSLIYTVTRRTTRCFEMLTHSEHTSSDTSTHRLHTRAYAPSPISQDLVSPQRNRPRFISHQQSISNQSMNTPMINTSEQWHAWFAQRRAQLRTRLEQAEQAEWNWPCTRRRCEIHRIEDELRALDAEEFVVPSFGEDLKTKVAAFAC